jgi:D-arabinose 5-phosphate isomerase GutQ
LPSNPENIGIDRDKIIAALTTVKKRSDKYTYFDKYGYTIGKERAATIYDTVFGPLNSDIIEFKNKECMFVYNSVLAMVNHIKFNVVPALDLVPKNIKIFVDLLTDTKDLNGRLIINAAGRVGEIAVFFQQKLRALGFLVDDLKEITPEFSINHEDFILTLSGSGQTNSVVENLVELDSFVQNEDFYRKFFSITTTPDNPTWKIHDFNHVVMNIPGRSKENIMNDEKDDGFEYLPLSSTFEYSVMLFLEGIIEILIARFSKNPISSPNSYSKKLTEIEMFQTVVKVIHNTIDDIKIGLSENIRKDEKLTIDFIQLLLSAVNRIPLNEPFIVPRIYLFGLGQNIYIARLFARRIQNIGFDVYVPGPREIVSSPRERDIAVFISNSGRNKLLSKLDTAIDKGCRTVLITAEPNSEFARKCNDANGICIKISNVSSEDHTSEIMDNNSVSYQKRFNKRSFELSAMFYLEGVSVALMKSLGIDETGLKHIIKEWE